MPKKIVVLRDKHKSPTRYYPKVLEECLPNDVPIKWTSKTKGNFTGKFYFDEWSDNALAPAVIIKKDDTHKAEIRAWGNNVLGNDIYGVSMSYQEGGSKLGTVEITKDGINISTVNTDVNINTTGNAKLYINGVEYQAGGGQLYQHEIVVSWNGSSYTCRAKRTIINSKAEEYTKDELKVMFGNGSVQAGMYGIVNTSPLNSLEYKENTNQWHFYYSGSFANTADSNVNVSDVVTPC